jgi:hypothetical protein
MPRTEWASFNQKSGRSRPLVSHVTGTAMLLCVKTLDSAFMPSAKQYGNRSEFRCGIGILFSPEEAFGSPTII